MWRRSRTCSAASEPAVWAQVPGLGYVGLRQEAVPTLPSSLRQWGVESADLIPLRIALSSDKYNEILVGHKNQMK